GPPPPGGVAGLPERPDQPRTITPASCTSCSVNAATTSSAEIQASAKSSGLSRRPANDTASAVTKPPANPPAWAQLLTLGMMNPNANITAAEVHSCRLTTGCRVRRP